MDNKNSPESTQTRKGGKKCELYKVNKIPPFLICVDSGLFLLFILYNILSTLYSSHILPPFLVCVDSRLFLLSIIYNILSTLYSSHFLPPFLICVDSGLFLLSIKTVLNPRKLEREVRYVSCIRWIRCCK
jgi:hypothetical protein